jgi:hypothetical protein
MQELLESGARILTEKHGFWDFCDHSLDYRKSSYTVG